MVHLTVNTKIIKYIHGLLDHQHPTHSSVFMVVYTANAQHKRVYYCPTSLRPPNTIYMYCTHGPHYYDFLTQTSVFIIHYNKDILQIHAEVYSCNQCIVLALTVHLPENNTGYVFTLRQTHNLVFEVACDFATIIFASSDDSKCTWQVGYD